MYKSQDFTKNAKTRLNVLPLVITSDHMFAALCLKHRLTLESYTDLNEFSDNYLNALSNVILKNACAQTAVHFPF